MAFCNKCGTKIGEESSFCHSCGTPTVATESTSPKKTETENNQAEKDPYKTIVRKKPVYGTINLENLPEGHVVVDRYEVKQKLGQGGFGSVYRVYDKKMGIDKALKILSEAVVSDREAMENLRKEAKTMARLNHPGIIRIFEFQEQGNIKYIDMEFVDGKELTGIKLDTPEKKLVEPEVRQYAVQIAKALSYAHSEGVIHKDIKPQNIIISKKNQVKIMDFGISETVRNSMSRIENTVSAGTLLYMSPEQIKGVNVGKEADIYSFGVMLYELIDGKPPFTSGDISYQILNTEVQTPCATSKPFGELIQKCLAKDYRERFRNFDEIIAILEGQKQPVPKPATVRKIAQSTVNQAVQSQPQKTAYQKLSDLNQKPIRTTINFTFSAIQSKAMAVIIVSAAVIALLLLPALIYYTGIFSSGSGKMEFVHIEPGTFNMGSPEDELFRNPDERLHEVILTEGIYMQTTEVTQGQWEEIMMYNPSRNSALFKKRANHPVENVSLADIQGFIDALNNQNDGWTYRLPTEAEWEYACRAGSTTPYSGTKGLNEMGWYRGNTTWFKNLFTETYPVEKKKPNAWGLYDMHGNVWELCLDKYGSYPDRKVYNPTGLLSGSKNTRRGGSFLSSYEECRSATRNKIDMKRGYRFLGFRLVRY